MKSEFDEHKAKGAACLLKQPIEPFVKGARWEFNKNNTLDEVYSDLDFATTQRKVIIALQKELEKRKARDAKIRKLLLEEAVKNV
jgi:hypothetical protein